MATRLFVGNIPDNAAENDLHAAFSAFGEITKLDLKSKPGEENAKKFAFISLSADNFNIESCIKHFSSKDFSGSRLYVTRARESFLERLQRERLEAEQARRPKSPERPRKNPVIKLSDKLNPRKRKLSTSDTEKPINSHHNNKKVLNGEVKSKKHNINVTNTESFVKETQTENSGNNKKKNDSEQKRIESLKRKRQEFKQKQQIIKTGLTAIDKVQNKKIRFDNDGESVQHPNSAELSKTDLFDDDGEDSDTELNFNIKQQYEGKKGQKVLDLQSRYKSDKRFVLDERFVDRSDDEGTGENTDAVDVKQTDEKEKQLDILQDVLGVTIKRKANDDDGNKKKQKIGMLRFDPTQPEHAKFLAPREEIKQETKKSKKKNKEKQEEKVEEVKFEEKRPEVSKEQFYKVSENLKEAIAQPTSFSLRSLFGKNENVEEEPKTSEEPNYIPIEPPKKGKIKNPLQPNERNPFVYDSSDSEDEADDQQMETQTQQTPGLTETKAVWKENLFFGLDDQRLKDGLEFFNTTQSEMQKDRRELKSVMKKRIYNKERKNQMFQKKIGGRKKTMKKSFRKKS